MGAQPRCWSVSLPTPIPWVSTEGHGSLVIRLIPIQALVACADRAADIVAPQLDSDSGGERYRLALDQPDSFINMGLTPADFPDPRPEREEVTARAVDYFSGMRDRGLFERVSHPAIFMYELSEGNHRQLGMVAGLPIETVDEGGVLGHEDVLVEQVEDLTAFFRRIRLSSYPVALGFAADDWQVALMEKSAATPPIRDFVGVDGVRQRLWAVWEPSDLAAIATMTSRIKRLYIIDGHHRVAAALGQGEPGWILAVLFPNQHLRVVEYNRVVTLDDAPTAELIRTKLGQDWRMRPIGAFDEGGFRPPRRGELAMALDGRWYLLEFVGESSDDPVGRLDVSLLHDRVLGPVFGISSYEHPRLTYVAGTGSLESMEQEVGERQDRVGFVMCPPSMDEMVAVSDAARLMPPKSTWFTPKPRAGLVVAPWDNP